MKTGSRVVLELDEIRNIMRANLPCELPNVGKMIRSKIGVLFFKALNVSINDDCLKFLSAIELIHNASLFHDDVIDEEDLRRNSLPCSKVYGEKTSILYGNIALSNALKILLELGNITIVNEMNSCVKKMCFGELLQMEQVNKIPTINEYIKKTRLKTSSLFRFLMSGVSILSGAKFKNEFESFGDNYGIGFQIKNDLSDYEKGVENSSDVKNGVFTAPIIFAKSIKQDDMAIAKTKDLIDNYLKRALVVLDIFEKSEYKTALIGVVECLRN
jgi:geranylgeranyl pyrophosphate synthase